MAGTLATHWLVPRHRQVVNGQHRVRLAAAESGLELDHRVAAFATEPLDHRVQQQPHAFGDEGTPEEQRRVLVSAFRARMHARQVGGEFSLQNLPSRTSECGSAISRQGFSVIPSSPHSWNIYRTFPQSALFLALDEIVKAVQAPKAGGLWESDASPNAWMLSIRRESLIKPLSSAAHHLAAGSVLVSSQQHAVCNLVADRLCILEDVALARPG